MTAQAPARASRRKRKPRTRGKTKAPTVQGPPEAQSGPQDAKNDSPAPSYPRRDTLKGRVPLLTAQTQKTICDTIASTSVTFADACLVAGVKSSTVRQWVQRGLGEHPTRSVEPRYVAFAEAIAHARAKGKTALVASIRQSGLGGYEVSRETITRPDGTVIERVRRQPPDWRAPAFILERRYPDEYGQQMAVKGEVGIDFAAIVTEARRRADARLAAAKPVGASSTPPAAALPAGPTNGQPGGVPP